MPSLRYANDVRLNHTKLLETIRQGGPGIAAIAIERGDSSIRLTKLLAAVPGVGKRYVWTLLSRAGITADERVNSPRLTQRQRHNLANQLRTASWRKRQP